VKLDSPFLPKPVNCALMPQDDGSHILVWSRDDRRQAWPPGPLRIVRGGSLLFSPRHIRQTAGRATGWQFHFVSVSLKTNWRADARQCRSVIEAQAEPPTRKETTMSKPSHIAYVVTDPKEGSDRKAIWREVGAIWPHKNGNGFDLVLTDQIAVSGRIVCTERKEKATEEAA
jgi:hypothetical protein